MTGRGAGRPQVGRWATLEAAKLRIRRAAEEDVDFLVELVNEDSVEPFLAASRARDPEGVLDEVQASAASPKESGVFVIEVADDGGWTRAGMMAFSIANQGNRIASLGGLAIHPDFRGHKLSDQAASIFQRHLIFDLDFHRLQLECYAFNERAIRHAERSGFVREGVKRKAYRRHGEWVDAIMFALIREDLEP
jgi:RimJ/RimL family protein N-acetyltransferase